MTARHPSLRFFTAAAVGLLLAAAVVPAAAPAAWAAVSGEVAGKRIAERYNVQVLKVRDGDIGGRKVWLVTVMKPGGNSNGAFQVHVLAVDQASGDLVPSFRHLPDGYVLPPPAPGEERR